jgi:hypothetical protein
MLLPVLTAFLLLQGAVCRAALADKLNDRTPYLRVVREEHSRQRPKGLLKTGGVTCRGLWRRRAPQRWRPCSARLPPPSRAPTPKHISLSLQGL